MEISNSAADMLADVIASYVNDNGDDRVQLIGEVLGTDSSGTTWVHILGGEQRTPVTSTNAKVHKGDIVYVVIGDGRADILGNVSRPATDDELAEVVQQRVIETERVVDRIEATAITAESAEIQQLNADHAVIETLDTTYASIDNLNAATARIGNIEADYLVADDMTAEQARVGQLMAGKANVADLTAANGRIDNLESTKADISLLESDYITADAIEAAYLKTDMSNTDVAWIENGTIKNGAISSAMINDVSANKLTAGTINGSIINVTNLNADNITAGTINGQRIGAGSLSLDKLSEDVYTEQEVDDKLSAMQAEIDGAIETWTGTAVPTLNNSPASGWSTSDERDRHVGDVYFVVNSNSQQNGYNYRFTKTNGTYSWQLIKDSDVTNALQRLSTAEGKITTFDSDISKLKTDTGTLTTKTESLETRMSDAEDDILDKVDTTTFNEVSDTVDQHSQSITQMSQTISNKADGSTVTALTNRVIKTEQDISGINTTIGTLQTTVESKADGSTVEAVSNRLNTVSDTVDGHTQSITSINSTLETKADSSTVSSLTTKVNTVSDTVDGHTQTIGSVQTTQTQMQGKLDKTIVETTQLWYSKSSTSAPNKPTSQVTSTSTAGNAWRTVVPAYNASYPNYFYCYQWKYTDGTYGWSSVTRDIAMGESQERARTAITNAAAADTKADNAASVAATAQSTAEGAASDASTAKTDAASAVSTANSAASDASTALSTANTANTNASTAVSTANTAAADASTAKTNASTAVSTANTAKATADKNVKSTLQLWYTKANDTAPSKPTSKVTSTSLSGNAWRVVVPTYSASYPYYFYCYQYELADGTYTWSDVVYDRATTENQSNSRSAVADVSTLTTKTNTISDTVDGHTSQLSSITSTQTTIQGSAVKSTVQLWFTKSNTTAPNKPTAHVTTNNASTANAWNLAVPTYNASYPNYFYCYEYQYLNDTYGWSAVTRDIATGEAQSTARTAASDASSAVSTANTANTNASNAVSTANTANTNASNAVSTANTANTNASNAVSTANTAAADASTAKTDAASAVSTANTASTNASAAVSTANTAKATADKNVKETILLWYSKANSTAPSKPTSAVTSTSTAGNAWRVVVPTYSASYPYYFYCYQYELADGTYAWSSVVYDQATTEAQSTARAASSSLATYITSNDAAIQSLQNQVDGQIEAWYYSVDPTTSNAPASDWTTDALKARHEGDLYYNVTSGHSWRWLKNGSTYSWQQIPDSDAAAALAAAQNAQSTANNKRRIFTATPTVPYDKGDLWVNGSVVKYATTARSSGNYTASDWSTTATDDTAANAAQATADKNVRESQQLWFTKANSTAPSKPTSKVTSTATTGNAWTTRVPTYSDSYKHYFYCMQYVAADGTVTWSDVIYDQATTEAQSVARAASADLTEFHQEYATFKQTTQQFESTVGETYATKTEISDAKTYVANAKANYGYQYKKDIVIYGESSKYYPVYFTNVGAIPQTVTHEIMIRREYSEQAPSDWYTSTHKGGLNIHFGWNFGGWGGATYKCEVYEFTQMYSTMVGDVLVGADAGMFSIVYLRGGGTTGALYHVYSDVPFTRHAYMTNAGVVGENDVPYIGLEQGVKYAQSTTGDNPTYKWNVRAPLTAPNTAHLNELYTVQRTALVESRMSTAETSIAQNKNDILLKANSSDVYTKQESDGLISTEVTNRNAAIQVSANAINQSVSETYTTKEDFKNLEIGGRNLLRFSDAVHKPTSYNAYDLYLSEPLEDGVPYIIQLWDVDVSHTGKTAATLGVNVYYCGSFVTFGGWKGTSYFTNGHADYLRLEFTAYTSGDTISSGGSVSPSPTNALAHTSVINTTKKYIRLYNSVPNANGTRNLTVGKWKLEKGNKATDWTPAPEDIESQVSAIEQRVSTNETSISNNATQINLRAKSTDVYTKTQTDGLISTEVTNRNAAITESANAINLSVSQKMSQTADSITESVSKAYATKDESQIDRSGSGTSTLVDGAASAALKGLHILGESIQDGTPTPSAPVEIQSVGATNLLTNTDTTLTATSGTTSNLTVRLGQLIPKGSTVTVSCYIEAVNVTWASSGDRRAGVEVAIPTDGVTSGTQYVGVWWGTNGSYNIGSTFSGRIAGTFKLTRAAAIDLPMGLYIQNLSSGSITISSVSLCVDKYNGSFVPSDSAGILVRGKNLFSNPMNLSYVQDDGSFIDSGMTNWTADRFPVTGSSVMLTVQDTGGYTGSFALMCYGSDGSCLGVSNVIYLSNITTPYTATLWLKDGTAWAIPRGYQSSTAENILLAQVQLELGSEATEYEPYRGTVTPIPLNGHELRSLPDGTQDELMVDVDGRVTMIQRVAAVTFHGNEGVSWNVRSTSNSNLKAFTNNDTSLVNVLGGTQFFPMHTEYAAANVISNRAEVPSNPPVRYSTWTSYGVSGWSDNTASFIFAIADGVTDSTGFNTWLMSNPTEVVYPLATPQTIDLGTIDMPQVQDGDTIEVIAAVTPSIDATWWATAGQAVADAYANLSSAIEVRAESITSTVASNYATKAAVQEISTQIEQTATGWTAKFNQLTGGEDLSMTLADAFDALGVTSANLEQIRSFVRITTDSNGDPLLLMGSATSPIMLALSNDSLEFRHGADRVAYIDVDSGTNEGMLHITRAVVVKELQFGSWKWFEREGNGNMALKWVGEEV